MNSESSCICAEGCTNKFSDNPRLGKASNLSVRGCKIPDFFDCYDEAPLKVDIEPRKVYYATSSARGKERFVTLNPEAMKQKYAKEYFPKPNECSGKTNVKGCFKVVYTSIDPRQIDVPRGMRVDIDAPPIDSTVRPRDVYGDELKGYGQKYRSYEDINAGQITYYIDKSIQDPLFSPNFTIPSKVEATLLQDPMNAMKPQYNRTPIFASDHLDTKRVRYNGGLSWLEDSLEQREDIMALQMRKRNQERWEPRWRKD